MLSNTIITLRNLTITSTSTHTLLQARYLQWHYPTCTHTTKHVTRILHTYLHSYALVLVFHLLVLHIVILSQRVQRVKQYVLPLTLKRVHHCWTRKLTRQVWQSNTVRVSGILVQSTVIVSELSEVSWVLVMLRHIVQVKQEHVIVSIVRTLSYSRVLVRVIIITIKLVQVLLNHVGSHVGEHKGVSCVSYC